MFYVRAHVRSVNIVAVVACCDISAENSMSNGHCGGFELILE